MVFPRREHPRSGHLRGFAEPLNSRAFVSLQVYGCVFAYQLFLDFIWLILWWGVIASNDTDQATNVCVDVICLGHSNRPCRGGNVCRQVTGQTGEEQIYAQWMGPRWSNSVGLTLAVEVG